MTKRVPEVNVVEAPTDPDTVVLVCSLAGTKITGQQLKDLVLAVISLIGSFEESNNDGYELFCKRFELPRNDITRAGYQRLSIIGLAAAAMSVRLTSILEAENMTLIDACLCPLAQLQELRNMGSTTLKEFQIKISDISGLNLVLERK